MGDYTISPPVPGETELQFWRRKALERAQRIAELEKTVAFLGYIVALLETDDEDRYNRYIDTWEARDDR